MSQLLTAPPQQDGVFIYHSGVFAVRLDEDGPPFTRADPDIIANMLRNDHVYFASDTTIFWRAQLAHYGLPPTSDTRGAKLRLESAIRRGSLRVPEAISDIEIRFMKQRWEAEYVKGPRDPGTDNESTNNLPAAPSETVEAGSPQRIAESVEWPPSSANATTKKEPEYTRDMQNTYRDPGAILWLAETNEPGPCADGPLTGEYICSSIKGFWRVPDGTLTLSHDPNCSTWWAHFRITFLEGSSSGGHIRSYYGMSLIPRGPQEDGKFWNQPLFSHFKLRSLQTSKVEEREGAITFDRHRGALRSSDNYNVYVKIQLGLPSSFTFKRKIGPGFKTDLQSEWDAFRN